MENDAPAPADDNEAKVAALVAALIEGEESGPPRPVDFEALKAEQRTKFEARKSRRP